MNSASTPLDSKQERHPFGKCFHCGRDAESPYRLTCRNCMNRLVFDTAAAVAKEDEGRVARRHGAKRRTATDGK